MGGSPFYASAIVGRPRSSSIAQSSDPAPPSNDPSLNRNLSTSAVPRSYRLSSNGIPAPPPGLVENLRASPARHSTVITPNPARSTSSMQVLSRTPMRSDSLYTHAPRASRSAEVGMIPPRKGPLIFAAMAAGGVDGGMGGLPMSP
ncbi:hypothetical protein BJ138DRAFT_1114873 [Hygrophoropsis aurantiaca]|uniref:Uncharacterized protein n=1 Tax=Hygrophoropsis aurantiaca TaxID=72124 RepID=A0ACB8A8J3_9AGAM|nr:hypothetical protein BJ138DRAFT_1114873 [Hygrophoropsis aurantiaca]